MVLRIFAASSSIVCCVEQSAAAQLQGSVVPALVWFAGEMALLSQFLFYISQNFIMARLAAIE